MGQLERGLNRIYGVEQDRPTVQQVRARRSLLAVSAGALAIGAFVALGVRSTDRRLARQPTACDRAWNVVRWPLALARRRSRSTALLFRWCPRRHQPGLVVAGVRVAVSVVLWFVVTVALGVFFAVSTRSVTPTVRWPASSRCCCGAALVDRDALRRRGRRPARSGAGRATASPRTRRRSSTPSRTRDADPAGRRVATVTIARR